MVQSKTLGAPLKEINGTELLAWIVPWLLTVLPRALEEPIAKVKSLIPYPFHWLLKRAVKDITFYRDKAPPRVAPPTAINSLAL